MVAKTGSLDVVFIVRSYLFQVQNGLKTVEAEQHQRQASPGDLQAAFKNLKAPADKWQ